jgi:hypothetical protein
VADLAAQALNIDTAIARSAINGADTPFRDARAMLRLDGPAILDGALDGTTVVEGIDETNHRCAGGGLLCARRAVAGAVRQQSVRRAADHAGA